MTNRTPSQFRRPVDQNFLIEHHKKIQAIDRRGILKGALSLGGLAMLGGCTISDDEGLQKVMRAISRMNDRAQALLFDPEKLAPTYDKALVVKPPRFNAYYGIEEVKPVEAGSWKLELAGLIADKRPWTAPMLAALPQREIVIRHICVEGWDYIGHWTGVPLRDFLTRIGADLSAKYLAYRCADNYPGSIDMATALHPQTILAMRYADEPIADPFGFPLRLRTATKLGYKNPKWLTALEVTNTYEDGFWEKQGFNWFAGM